MKNPYDKYINKTNDKEIAILKNSFDTRRVDQSTQYIPRANLQFWTRSEAFISKNSAKILNELDRLKSICDEIKKENINKPQWFQSITSETCNKLDDVLRVNQQDGEYSEKNLNYFDEMFLYSRYKFNTNNMVKFSDKEIKEIIVNKDEKLSQHTLYEKYVKHIKRGF